MSGIYLAADGLSLDSCCSVVSGCGDQLEGIKIHNLYDQHGRTAVERIRAAGGASIWVDLKLKDIPKTVELRARALFENGADIITVHADGEIDMMMAAVLAAQGQSRKLMPQVYAVSVLTSLSEEEVQLLYHMSPKAAVLYFARMAKLAGVHGIVCSPQEVRILARRPELRGMQFIVPGVRSPGKDVHDQQRVDTPANAKKAGATHLVIGRQVTEAESPSDALLEIKRELSQVSSNP